MNTTTTPTTGTTGAVLIVAALTLFALLFTSCAPVQKCPQAYRHQLTKHKSAKAYNYYKPTAAR